MYRLNSWQSGTSILLMMGMLTSTLAPIITPAPAVAQLFPSNGQVQTQSPTTIPSGITIPVRYEKSEKIVMSPTETIPLTLIVAANIKTRNGTLLIPAGSEIEGNLQPVEGGGAQFVATNLKLYNGRNLPIDATSNVITKTEEVSKGTSTTSILKGAAIGAGAAAAISGIIGNRHITIGKVLGGGALGAIGGLLLGKKKVNVIVINPNSDLDLTLQSELALQ